jgi:hypothetical protein
VETVTPYFDFMFSNLCNFFLNKVSDSAIITYFYFFVSYYLYPFYIICVPFLKYVVL